MAKSRMAAALAVATLWTAAEAVAQRPAPLDAQALIDAQRTALTEGAQIGCRRGSDPEEIVVCGTREDMRYRVPDVVEPGEVRPSSRAGGEQLDAMSNNRCVRLCHQPVGVSIVDTRAGTNIFDSVARAIERLRDDE